MFAWRATLVVMESLGPKGKDIAQVEGLLEGCSVSILKRGIRCGAKMLLGGGKAVRSGYACRGSSGLVERGLVPRQVYVALKVGLFKDHTLFKAPPAPLETVHGQPLVSLSGVIPLWTIPFGLVMTVLGVNMEAMAFAALVNDVWYPKPYSCPSLHIHPLDYEPKKVAMSCKSCGKNIRQGFKVAFSCRKCGYTCCLACYR